MLALAISLASAVSWGVSDFLGGLQSRRLPVLGVLAVSQPAGLVLIALLIPLFGADPISAGKLGDRLRWRAPPRWAGLGAFYAAMAMGTVSVVAPIASLGVVVPVVVGLAAGRGARGDPAGRARPGDRRGGHPELRGAARARAAPARRSIVLAILAGLGFGIFFTGLDAAAADRPGWAILAVRVGGVAAVAAALLSRDRGSTAVEPALAGPARDRRLRRARQRPVRGRLDQGRAPGGRGRRLDVPGLHRRSRARSCSASGWRASSGPAWSLALTRRRADRRAGS